MKEKYKLPISSTIYSIIDQDKEIGRLTHEGEFWYLEIPVGTHRGGSLFHSREKAVEAIDTWLDKWQQDDWPHASSERVAPALLG